MSSTESGYQSLVSQIAKTSLRKNFSRFGLKSGCTSSEITKSKICSAFSRFTLENIALQYFCDLQVVPITTSPEYEAFPYVWGDLAVTKEIRLSGKPFFITADLESALQRLRFPDTTRRLWADAICMDQKNLAERSKQVQIMDKIYSGAVRVLVWLGEAD